MARVWRIGPPVLTGSRLQRLAEQCWRLARQGYKRKLTEARKTPTRATSFMGHFITAQHEFSRYDLPRRIRRQMARDVARRAMREAKANE